MGRGVIIALLLLLSSAIASPLFYERLEGVNEYSQLPEAVIEHGDQKIYVELAEDDLSRAYGLMNRLILPQNRGMLFIFDREAPRSFWMKNTKIPLDILYLDAEGRVLNIEYAEPCLSEPCRSYPSKYPAQYVLELGKGEAERLGLRVGGRIGVSDLEKE